MARQPRVFHQGEQHGSVALAQGDVFILGRALSEPHAPATASPLDNMAQKRPSGLAQQLAAPSGDPLTPDRMRFGSLPNRVGGSLSDVARKPSTYAVETPPRPTHLARSGSHVLSQEGHCASVDKMQLGERSVVGGAHMRRQPSDTANRAQSHDRYDVPAAESHLQDRLHTTALAPGEYDDFISRIFGNLELRDILLVLAIIVSLAFLGYQCYFPEGSNVGQNMMSTQASAGRRNRAHSDLVARAGSSQRKTVAAMGNVPSKDETITMYPAAMSTLNGPLGQATADKAVVDKAAADKATEDAAVDKAAADKATAEKAVADKAAAMKAAANIATAHNAIKAAAEKAAADKAKSAQEEDSSVLSAKLAGLPAQNEVEGLRIGTQAPVASDEIVEQKMPAIRSASARASPSSSNKTEVSAELIATEAHGDATNKSLGGNLASRTVAKQDLAAWQDEKTVVDKAAADKAAGSKSRVEKAVVAKAAVDKAAADKASAEKAVADEAAADKATAEKEVAEKSAADKETVDKATADKAAAEKAAADKANAVTAAASSQARFESTARLQRVTSVVDTRQISMVATEGGSNASLSARVFSQPSNNLENAAPNMESARYQENGIAPEGTSHCQWSWPGAMETEKKRPYCRTERVKTRGSEVRPAKSALDNIALLTTKRSRRGSQWFTWR